MPEEAVMTSQVDGKGAEEAETGTAEKSPSQKTDTTGKTGEVEKTQGDEVAEETEVGDEDEQEVAELLKTNQPIPFKRFKAFIDKRNSERAATKSETENFKSLFENPAVFEAVLRSKGITDPKILNEKMKEAGFDVEDKSEKSEDELFESFSEGLDLTKQGDWFKVMSRMAQHFAKESVKPLEGKLSDKEVEGWVSTQEGEAKKIADGLKIPYGTSGKDEKNINTAVGIMAKYLNEHPEDAGLGHVKILRLALSDKGFNMGKEQGKAEAKKRNDALRRSAMEDDGQAIKEGTPNSTWSVQEILAWRRKNQKE